MKLAVRFCLLMLMSLACMSTRGGNVSGRAEILMGTQVVELPLQTTQTEIKPGWKIVDVQLKSKMVRYLWGAHASQPADDVQPVLYITPADGETLYNYALMPLKKRREWRQFSKPQLKDNKLTRITPDDFSITIKGDSTFCCKPLQSLLPGEYFLVNADQEPIGKLGDYQGYSFRVLDQ